jgi:hypothetical protein
VLRVHQERRLGGAASALAGARVAVRCQSFGGAFVDARPELGYVRWRADGKPEPWTLIKRDQCRHLAARSDKRRPSRDQVVAVHVLTHEAMHLSGRLNEAAAECAAVQRDARIARLLGAPAELAAAYWRNLYPLMPDGYRSADCRLGGPLDEGLADARGLRGRRPRCSIRAAREADQPRRERCHARSSAAWSRRRRDRPDAHAERRVP